VVINLEKMCTFVEAVFSEKFKKNGGPAKIS
jgi:hypothetical protein